MLWSEFIDKNSYTKEEILALAAGTLVEDPPAAGVAKLPLPPFLMFDRIPLIERNGRTGKIVAEQDVHSDAWYFQCHFRGDPVQPGCLGVDALWQLLGLYCAANGAEGTGRALGCGQIEFSGQIRPFDKLVTYEVDVRRFTNLKDSGSSLAIANGRVSVDGEEIYKCDNLKVGVFKDIAYDDYPNPDSQFARGGLMVRE
jgi:3-hydroxyacyl-[acyl-carrier protein] dehydratase/trans-2-decenoyl-[acyl-carrier protein] isomerase